MTKRIILLPFLFIFQWMMAQDAHLSHAWNETSEINPAATAFCSNEIRLGVFYRTQWMAIPQPYQHYGIIADMNLKKLGLGISVFSNHAGPASLNTTKARLTGAWHAQLAAKTRLSVGFGLGMLQKRVNPASFKFDKQYLQGQGFDSANDNGEIFLTSSGAGFDLSGGLELQIPFSKNTQLRGGLAMDHINQPKFSFIDSDKTGIYTKWTGYAQFDFQATELLTVAPRAVYRMQGPAKEILLGLEGGYQLNERNLLTLGVANRFKDAVIVNAGIQFQQLEVGMSYDLNISVLTAASNGNGALEVMLLYSFNRRKPTPPIKSDIVEVPDIVAPPVKPTTPPTTNDRDKDGIPDHLDDCPDTPGKYRFQGCNDKDEDGIWDAEDRCPNLFGVRENGGCPARLNDTDGDGVLDHVDNCVFIKGEPSLGGCPDTDKDGIMDPEDNCPYIKGLVSLKGCPAEIMPGSQPKTISTPATLLRPQNVIVFFDSDKALINPMYYSVLNEMARLMKEDPGIQVLLSGHTDHEGSVSYNFSLSERRNIAVQRYLIGQGVDASQIRLMAYGETIPRGSNATMSGKEENRRVEIVIVSGY